MIAPTLHEPKFIPVAFHEACIALVQKALNKPLLRESRATFVSPDRQTIVVCSVSREYDKGEATSYWFAFHPHQRNSLAGAAKGFVTFGCGSPAKVLLIPFREFEPWLEGMNVTEREDRMYWHIHIAYADGRFILAQKKGLPKIDLTRFALKQPEPAG